MTTHKHITLQLLKLIDEQRDKQKWNTTIHNKQQIKSILDGYAITKLPHYRQHQIP